MMNSGIKTERRRAQRVWMRSLLPLTLEGPCVEVRVPEHRGWKRAVLVYLPVCLVLIRNRESRGITWSRGVGLTLHLPRSAPWGTALLPGCPVTSRLLFQAIG